MNYYVPDFEMEDEQPFISTSSSTVTHPHKAEDEILELLWQDGQVVAQPRKFQSSTALAPQHNQQQQQQQEQQLYMAEDEMATWLHYPIEDLYSDLISDNPSSSLPPVSTVRQSTVIRPPIPPPQQVEAPIQQPQIKVAAPLQQPQLKVAVSLQQQSQSKVVAPPRQPPSKVAVAVAQEKPPVTVVAPLRNFQMFSRMRGKGPEVRAEKAVVDSNTTPVVAAMRSVGEVSSSVGGCRLLETGGGSGEMTVSSSSGTSGGGGGPTNNTCTTGDVLTVGVSQLGRKRKQRGEIDETATTPTTTTDQDVELDAADDEKKHPQGLHSMKRTRAAEVHNLSERKRRDRINEKMKALQELIPRCNKSDKASMLDEVIEYLKSLQMQVQMMSMGCGMVPMMYPGMQQQFMPPTMGMGMGMDTGMNRPMMPFPSNMPASNLPTTSAVVGAGPHIAPNFGIQPVPMPSVPAAANFPVNQGDSVRSSFPVQTPPGLPQQPSMGDQYQQFMALQQMQMQMQMHMQMQMQAAQNQSISRPGSSKPSTSKSEGPSGPSTSKSEGPPGPSTSKSEAEDDE